MDLSSSNSANFLSLSELKKWIFSHNLEELNNANEIGLFDLDKRIYTLFGYNNFWKEMVEYNFPKQNIENIIDPKTQKPFRNFRDLFYFLKSNKFSFLVSRFPVPETAVVLIQEFIEKNKYCSIEEFQNPNYNATFIDHIFYGKNFFSDSETISILNDLTSFFSPQVLLLTPINTFNRKKYFLDPKNKHIQILNKFKYAEKLRNGFIERKFKLEKILFDVVSIWDKRDYLNEPYNYVIDKLTVLNVKVKLGDFNSLIQIDPTYIFVPKYKIAGSFIYVFEYLKSTISIFKEGKKDLNLFLNDPTNVFSKENPPPVLEVYKESPSLPSEFFSTRKEFVTAENPINPDEKCQLIISKKTNYYIYDYNPEEILKFIDKNNDYYDRIMKSLVQTFDLVPKRKCCNCISITLYFLKTTDLLVYQKYLSSIWRTVKNVEKNLPEFLVRIFIDKSVFTRLNKNNLVALESQRLHQNEIPIITTNTLKQVLQNILDAPNVEVYTFLCKDLISGEIPIARSRIFRFSPFLDPEVNICIVREADGTVTYEDCHNIRMFSHSNRIFMFSPMEGTEYLKGEIFPFKSYSRWLTIYKKQEKEFFTKNFNVVDILAGLLGIKLQVKKDYFNAKTQYVKNSIRNELISYNESLKKFYLSNFKDENYPGESTESNISFERRKNTLDTGYDEILLLELFKNFISSEIYEVEKTYLNDKNIQVITKKQLYNEENLKIIKSLFYSFSDFVVVKYSTYHNFRDIKNATELNKIITSYHNFLVIHKAIKNDIFDPTVCLDRLDAFKDIFYYPNFYLYLMDSFLIRDKIITKSLFNIKFTEGNGIFNLSNIPYNAVKDMKEVLDYAPNYFDIVYESCPGYLE